MRIRGWLTRKHIGVCLVLILAAPSIQAAATPPQEEPAARLGQSAPDTGAQKAASSESNAKAQGNSAEPDAALPDAPEIAQAQPPTANGQESSSRPSQDQQQNPATPAEPIGTAAAPGVTRTGVTASKPAGAAIAPAKQRRVRTILISLGVVAAAGIAIGATAGISRTSPSQPK